MTTQQVLLVEDNAGDADLILDALDHARTGRFKVKRVARLDAALACLKLSGIDAVLLDLSLPDSEGLETLATMQRRSGNTPIVILTGFEDEAVALDALSRGAQDYLIKGHIDGDGLARSLLYAIERRRVHEELERREAQLAEAQAIANLGSWEWDITSDTISWSREMYHIHGVDPAPGDARLTLARMLSLIHPADSDHVAAAFSVAKNGTKPLDITYRIHRPNREIRHVHCKAHVSSGSGPAPSRIGTVQDVTERHKLEEQLSFAERMAAVGALASGVAHDINNPLAYVMGNLAFATEDCQDLLQQCKKAHALLDARRGISGAEFWNELGGGTLPAKLTKVWGAVQDATQGAERIKAIVQDLRLFSRADEDRDELVSVEKCLDSCINMAWNEIRHRARLVKEFSEVPPVEANESRLGQVFLNILINAAQAIPDGNLEQNVIRVRTLLVAEQVVVEVQDTGCGIDAETRKHIFDRFFTTKPRGIGTGLGLAISSSIVSAVGGSIEVESEPGKGSLVRVLLPAARQTAAEGVPLPSPAAAAGPRRRILVIDDELPILNVVGRALSFHDVTLMSNALEALTLVEQAPQFDLILCDVMMPQMSGMSFHDALSRVAPDMARRVVFLTGGAFTPAAREFLDRVPNSRLTKPFMVSELRALVESWPEPTRS